MEGLYWALIKLRYMLEYPETVWSTQEVFLLGKIQTVGQPAGNQILLRCNDDNKVGSSETTREALNTLCPDFKNWFIGFTEGDGSFIVDGSRGYLEFKVTQSSVMLRFYFT